MRSLILLVAATAVVSGQRDVPPGFTVDYRGFVDSPVYREQRLPDRDLSRSFRESPQSSTHHQRPLFREETSRDYRQPFSAREETSTFHPDNRGGYKGDNGGYKDENHETFADELRSFNTDSRQLRDDTRIFKDDVRSFRDESRNFFDGPRHFTDDGPFRNERRPYRDEIRPYREDYRTFRDEVRAFKDDFRNFESTRNFRDQLRSFGDETERFRDGRPYREESGPLKNELRPFKDESGSFRNEPRPFKEESQSFGNEARPFKEESRTFGNEPRPFKDESGPFRNEPRPFKEESVSLRNELRPFGDHSESFKDEILFTQESQSLAGARNRYNKEQDHRQPLSFGGHSNYLKYGNHGLGFASVPAAVLPLEDGSHRGAPQITGSKFSQTAATQSPGTSSSAGTPDSKNQISVTLAPESASTPSKSPSGNAIGGNAVNNERKNEKVNSLIDDEASTSQASTAVTISTSGGTNVTPKVVFGSGSSSMSNSPMVISNSDASATGMHQSNTASDLHVSKSLMHSATPTNSYFPGDTNGEVPAALLNYIFKYQQPQETKMRYVYRQSLPTESFDHIRSLLPGHHHQTAKYAFLPEFKIPGLSGIQQPGGTLNYVSATGLPKLSYINGNSPGLTLGQSYSTDAGPTVNFAQNVLQLDQGSQFTHLGQTEGLTQLRPIQQTEQFSQLQQIANPTSLNQLGQYGQFGQVEQARNNPFGQGGLQLQLGGFGGIDFSALSSNSEATRASPTGSLGISKVGLSFSEPVRPPAPAFTKLSFGESLW